MVIMCDLCVRYTYLVDGYVSNSIAICLRDTNEIVRKQTLILITRLLQEDFVKWKGSLFYRYVVALVDDSMEIQQSATFCFVTLLKTKNPIMFFTHFIETMFYINNYLQHPIYNQFGQSEKEKMLFSLAGNENKKKRMTIYQIFLNNMTEEQKFQITAKLCQEILAGVTDNAILFDFSGSQLLGDALDVLGCKEIKLRSSHTRSAVDDEEALSSAKENLLSKIVKKNVLENVIPIIIELKHFLEKRQSPLLKNLMEYLKELLKDFKDEVEDILVADRQLAKEIQYDIRQFTLQQKRIQSPSLKSPTRVPPNRVFSPRTSSPRPELANFSVPKLRSALTITSISGSKTFDSNSVPISPLSRSYRRVSIANQEDEVLQSPETRSFSPTVAQKRIPLKRKTLASVNDENQSSNLKRMSTGIR